MGGGPKRKRTRQQSENAREVGSEDTETKSTFHQYDKKKSLDEKNRRNYQ